MSASEILNEPWIERAGWILFHSTWQLTLLCGVAVLLFRVLRYYSPQARYLTGCFILAAMVTAPFASHAWLVPPTSNRASTQTTTALNSWNKPATPTSDSAPDTDSERDDAIPPTTILSSELSTVTDTPPSWIVLTTEMVRPALPWLVLLWYVGFALVSLHHLGGWIAVGQVRRRGVRPVAEPLAILAARLSQQLGIKRHIALLESTFARVPMVIGFWRPVVLLPIGTITGLSLHEIEAILAHELIHIRRYDYLVNLLQMVTETLLFYHPAVWWISRRIRLEREYCADRLAAELLGSQVQYATALANLAEQCTVVPTTAVAATGSQLRRRILYLLDRPADKPSNPRALATGIAICLVITAAMFLLVPEHHSLAAVPEAESAAAKMPSTEGPAQRVLHFPKDHSLGTIWLRDANARRYINTYYYWADNNVEDISFRPARGDVVIPAGKLVILSITLKASSDLSPLAKLPPDALYEIIFNSALDKKGKPRVADDVMEHVCHFTGLKSLGLHFTRIGDRGLRKVKRLKQLEQLYLPQRATDDSLAVLKHLPSLKRLYFKSTHVTNQGLKHLAKLQSLEELELGGKRIGDAGLVHLTGLSKLDYLLLWGDNFTDDGLAHVAQIRSLRVLTLPRGTYFTNDGMKHLAKLPRLENLYAAGNPNLTADGMAHLARSPSLKKLDISSYGSIKQFVINDDRFKHLARIKTLERLDAFNVPMGDQGIRYLSTLPNLRTLRIPQPSFISPATPWDFYTDEGLASLAKLDHLEELMIGGAELTNAGMDHVARMTQLKRLALGDCHVTDDGLAKLNALHNLETLNLHLRDATLSGLNSLKGLTNLKALDAQFLPPDEEPLDLSGMVNLEVLMLTRRPGSDQDLSSLANLKHLRRLTARTDDASVVYLTKLPRLESLDLSGELTDASLKQIGSIHGLSKLNVAGHFTDDGLRHLAGLRNLIQLTLSTDGNDGYFTDKALQHLESLDNLQMLNIPYDVGLSKSTAAKLLKKLPYCHFRGPNSMRGMGGGMGGRVSRR